MTTSLGYEFYKPVREQDIGKICFPRIPSGTTMLSSTGSSGCDETSSQPNYATYTRSNVEDSGNVNNRGFATSISSLQQYPPVTRHLHRSSSGTDKDSSTLANTGAVHAQYLRNTNAGSSLNRHSDHVRCSTNPVSNDDSQHPPLQRCHSLGDNSATSEAGTDNIIEEKRKRTNGDGYTIHRYTRGKLLGKGGFAKVYLCTAMDTGKNYAVKVVPKANLVKARARQKVSLLLAAST